MRTVIYDEKELVYEFINLKKSKTIYLDIAFPHSSIDKFVKLVKGKFQIKKL